MTENNSTDENENERDAIGETIEEVDDILVEDPTLVEFGSDKGNQEDSRLEFVREWFPEENDWRGKTRISPTQARALTVMRHLPNIYGEELLGKKEEELAKLLNSLADNIEVYQTSIGGQSRAEQKDILELAFGGHSEKRESQETSMMDRLMQDYDSEK